VAKVQVTGRRRREPGECQGVTLAG
jgi:hypothetical protein